MPTFTVEKIKEIDGKVAFYQLRVDNILAYDEFCKQIKREGSFAKELIKIQTRMQEISEMKSLPQTKFKNITPKGEKLKEYEIKTENLRVYLFHEEFTGKIIVCAGKKSTQPKDIKYFRSLKKIYLKDITR